MIPRQILDDHAIRVLLIAPDEADHMLVARLVSEFRHGSYTLDWAASHADGRTAISADDHDVYLVHEHLGTASGLDLIAESIKGGSSTPYIILSAHVDYDLDIEALGAGATDHLATDQLDADSLERAIRHALIHSQARAELVAAKEEAESATRAKTKYLANVSHDIRTPLNAVIGITEIVLRDSLTPTQKESLETVLVAAESLLDLADRLVDVSKIELGEIEINPSPFNIRDAVADVIRIFGLQARQRGLQIEADIKSDVPETLVGDAARIQQVLIDLVSNAVRYTEQGRIDISVENVDEHDGPPQLLVSVEDTGVGIPADLLPTLFEQSEQANTATGSTGLGVVSRIVAAMGGEVSVSSRVGRGSRFSFTIAVEVADGTAAGTPTPGADSSVVLVMSSSPDDRRNLEADLLGGGLEPLIVGDIGAAADAASAAGKSEQRLDAIVLDTAYKPVESARTRMDLSGGPVPVTLTVPSGREGDEPRCREAGVKGYVGKPTAPGVLVDVVKATIAATRAGDTDTLFTADSLVSSRPSMNILVVDDVETNLVLTVRMLTERGHRAVAVRNGIEAIDAFEQSRFDAVLMDLQMPGLDGFDTTAAMRAEEVLQGIARTPIIALTGHTTTEERDRCVVAGMDGFLSKPVRPDALFAAVEQFAASAAAA